MNTITWTEVTEDQHTRTHLFNGWVDGRKVAIIEAWRQGDQNEVMWNVYTDAPGALPAACHGLDAAKTLAEAHAHEWSASLVLHCSTPDCDNPADEGPGELCSECRIETTCELCGSTTDVRMRLATYQNNAWLERVCDVCVAYIRADCDFERPWYQDATTCDSCDEPSARLNVHQTNTEGVIRFTSLCAACRINADYDAHGCRQENDDRALYTHDAFHCACGKPKRHQRAACDSCLYGPDDEHALYQRLDDGFRKQQLHTVARAMRFAALALALLPFGASAAETIPYHGNEWPYIGTPAFSESCAIYAAWEDGSALATCKEDGTRWAYDPDGQYVPNIPDNPVRDAGWYPAKF